MTVDERHYNKLSNRSFSLFIIGELWGLTEEELDHPNCGQWIKDQITQLQQSQLLINRMKERSADNKKVENYAPDPFKNRIASDANNKPH